MNIPFNTGEVRRAAFIIQLSMACCGAWALLNGAAAWLMGEPRLYDLSAAALGMVACWAFALRDLQRGRVMRGVLNYVTSGLLLLLVMGLCVPDLAVLFVFATFILLAYGLSYADTRASFAIVGLTMLVAAALLIASHVVRMTSGINPALLRWVNVTGMAMALAIDAVSFVALRRTLEDRGRRLSDEAKFRALTEAASDAIVTATQDGTIAYVNASAETMFGWMAAELIGRPLTTLMPERFREAHRRGLESLIRTGTPRVIGQRAVELVGLRRNAVEFPIELSLATWYADATQSFSAIVRDITERRRIEDELRAAKERAEAASGELEAFSYSVAHDLRSPLRAIHGYSAMLVEEHSTNLDPEARDHLARIKAGAVRMATLIDALLLLSRTSRAEIRRSRVDLGVLAQTVVGQLRAAEGASGRPVDFEIAGNLEVQADAPLALVLLENLLGNAWKFSSKTPAPRVMLGCERDGIYFVRDNGAGFDMAFAEKLFKPFQRLHASDEFPGTGIGLATVQRVIARHGGRLWAESAPGKGAVFRFTFGAPSNGQP